MFVVAVKNEIRSIVDQATSCHIFIGKLFIGALSKLCQNLCKLQVNESLENQRRLPSSPLPKFTASHSISYLELVSFFLVYFPNKVGRVPFALSYLLPMFAEIFESKLNRREFSFVMQIVNERLSTLFMNGKLVSTLPK